MTTFVEVLSKTCSMLLEYHEEWGVHHIEEVTKLLWVLSDATFDKENNKVKMDFSPFLGDV